MSTSAPIPTICSIRGATPKTSSSVSAIHMWPRLSRVTTNDCTGQGAVLLWNAHGRRYDHSGTYSIISLLPSLYQLRPSPVRWRCSYSSQRMQHKRPISSYINCNIPPSQQVEKRSWRKLPPQQTIRTARVQRTGVAQTKSTHSILHANPFPLPIAGARGEVPQPIDL
jgi:hypothetical protein